MNVIVNKKQAVMATTTLTTYCISLILMFLVFISNEHSKVQAVNPQEVNECQRCKILIKSVKYWLAQTSRGFHEGGDTAWQEANLKSYARSEMRLVEIQERLCSELELEYQDECYAITEETDQLLDKWWFHEDYKSLDLFNWLCVETLVYCCPKDHYGPTCDICPLDVDQKVCSGNGKCNGEGSRYGNGTCICNKGYTGNVCDVCAENYYTSDDMCKACHVSCQGCHGDGPETCHLCKPGWQHEAGVCMDVDECADLSACEPRQLCINTEGSHLCKNCDKTCQTCAGAGPRNCTSCEPNLVMLSGMCIDDERLTYVMQRSALYILIVLLTVFVFQRSKEIAYYMILSASLIIYYFEESSQVGLLDLINHIFF